jgi:hypothetical protein
MAQAGFILSDEGRTFTAVNDSTTTAITAGDPVYFTTNNDVITGTAASVRAAYAAGDVKVKTCVGAAAGFLKPAGVALTDCPAEENAVVTIALSGVFMHPTKNDTEAGDPVGFVPSEAKVRTVSGTAGVSLDSVVGRALTGGSADGKYIIWKLNL